MLCIVGAVFSPFYFYWRYSDYGDYTGLAALGPVGDFVGGTTVTFFTAASVFLLIATNIMQREELKASVEQAKLARKETQITNETMKRQQFETTFFNMLNLHRDIVENLSVNYWNRIGDKVELKGAKVFEGYIQNLESYYHQLVDKRFKKSYLEEDYDEVLEFLLYLQEQELTYIGKELPSKEDASRTFERIDFLSLPSRVKDKKIVKEYFKEVVDKYDENLILTAYDSFLYLSENNLKSYFNSLTTTLKFLSDSLYEKEDKEKNTQNYRIYREILFSQFTANEMMLLYYHAMYSPQKTWLQQELRLYSIFYPNLNETQCLFGSIDKENIEALSQPAKWD